MLVILGGNPAYDAPADLNFADALKGNKVPLRVHYGLYNDETAELCHWHVNGTHELEAWGDARAYDGTVSIIQPLIAPLYNAKSPIEFVALLAGQSDASGMNSFALIGRSSTVAVTSMTVLAQVAARWLDRRHDFQSKVDSAQVGRFWRRWCS